MSEEDKSKYLNYEDASKYIGVDRRTITRYVKEKKLKKYIFGVRRKAFFEIEELNILKEAFDTLKEGK